MTLRIGQKVQHHLHPQRRGIVTDVYGLTAMVLWNGRNRGCRIAADLLVPPGSLPSKPMRNCDDQELERLAKANGLTMQQAREAVMD